MLNKIMPRQPKFRFEKHEVYKGCSLVKYAKTNFPSSDTRSKDILDLIHSDIYEHMSVVYLSVYCYYATFLDDFSMNIWIFFLNNKDEVFSRFKEFKALVEN